MFLTRVYCYRSPTHRGQLDHELMLQRLVNGQQLLYILYASTLLVTAYVFRVLAIHLMNLLLCLAMIMELLPSEIRLLW